MCAAEFFGGFGRNYLRGSWKHWKYICSQLLPDGRIFCQISQKRPTHNFHGRKKLEALKWQHLAKSGRKEARKYFYKYLNEKNHINKQNHIFFCTFLDFINYLLQ
jgi:hypothetical protein